MPVATAGRWSSAGACGARARASLATSLGTGRGKNFRVECASQLITPPQKHGFPAVLSSREGVARPPRLLMRSGQSNFSTNPKGSLSHRDRAWRHEFLASRRERFAKTARTGLVRRPPRTWRSSGHRSSSGCPIGSQAPGMARRPRRNPRRVASLAVGRPSHALLFQTCSSSHKGTPFATAPALGASERSLRMRTTKGNGSQP
jgi:hypothetical protein